MNPDPVVGVLVEAAKHVPALLVTVGAVVYVAKALGDRYERFLKEMQTQHAREMDALRAQQTEHVAQLRDAHAATMKSKDEVIERQVKQIAALERRLGRSSTEGTT